MRAFDKHDQSPRGLSSLLALVGFIGLCQLVGVAGGTLTADSVRGWYLALARPAGVPPNWVFPVVWTSLYAMMGTAAWLVWRRAEPAPDASGGDARRAALRLWGWQLLANALWTPAFFGLHSPALGLAVLAALLPLIGLTLRAFLPLDRRAAALMAPYLLWSLYATYLNAGFWWLNP